ncbi:interferon-induced protein 44-like isoform X2 [Salarias fasciatus]|uniref:interferon-induced protein 44-like isoform X2 n=1 Tax=Salarias fasciatus TaxID=181472 RepID=UPI0011765A20|nr:interferon-induced protein 44-like isoform X2 [Salarias fasciatus]
MGGVLLSKPWRTLPEDYEKSLYDVKLYKPRMKSVKHVRILLHGPVGAGKSTFINSVNSLFQRRITCGAMSDGANWSSFTQKYTTYKIEKSMKESYNFVFNDTKGLEEPTNSGIDVEDIKCVLKGHVRDGYKFNSENPISEDDDFYNANPILNDKVHVVVFVIPADKISLISETMRTKMRNIRLAASEEGIPQLIVLTKVDEYCPKVKEDITHVYRSRSLKEQVDKASQLLGLPPNCIFLVKNYHTEMAPNDNMNALILFALRQMINLGEDYLNSLPEPEEDEPEVEPEDEPEKE